MCSRNLSDLTPEMEEKARNVIKFCKEREVTISVYCTLRSLEEQAKIYRLSRTKSQINEKIKWLESQKLDFLGRILENVGPQHGQVGEHITNALPGFSWHSYGEAFDAVIIDDKTNKAIWNTKHPSWLVYADAVRKNGLTWGGDFKSIKDYPHAQLRSESNPTKIYTPEQIKQLLINNNQIIGIQKEVITVVDTSSIIDDAINKPEITQVNNQGQFFQFVNKLLQQIVKSIKK